MHRQVMSPVEEQHVRVTIPYKEAVIPSELSGTYWSMQPTRNSNQASLGHDHWPSTTGTGGTQEHKHDAPMADDDWEHKPGNRQNGHPSQNPFWRPPD